VQPLGAGLESPFEPPRALVELANEHQQLVGCGVELGGEVDDGPVEVIDGEAALGDGSGAGHEILLDRIPWTTCNYIQHLE